MKKLILIALLFVGCKQYTEEITYETHYETQKYGVEGSVIRTTKIEGCDYFVCETRHSYYVLSHKGNCPNPIHKCK